MTTEINNTPNLVTFGEEFEKHGGLRILSMAETMHDEDPVDDLWYYVDSCNRYLAEEQVLAGYTKDEDLFPLIEACYELRMEYGHGVWVGGALLDYLRGVKGIDDAEAVRDRMVAEAEAQFAPLVEQYLHERRIEHVEELKQTIPMYEKLLKQAKENLASAEQKLAQAA